MNTFNLEKMPSSELRELSAAVEQQLKRRKKDDIKKAREQIEILTGQLDMSVDEIMNYRKRGKRYKAPAKYRNPQNHQQTWSGRGKKPSWLLELTEQGKNLDDFLIKPIAPENQTPPLSKNGAQHDSGKGTVSHSRP